MIPERFVGCLCALILCLAALPARVEAGCGGGAGCARSDSIDIVLTAIGPTQGTLFGFTDADYKGAAPDEQSSCEQPGDLQTTRFEFAGDLPGVGAVRLYLDPARSSGGSLVPQSLPQSASAIDPDGGLFPAVNEMKFYLRLDIPDLGLELANIQPLTVKAVVGSWPPPVGTAYQLQQQVQFAERDPLTGAPTGPVLATVQLGSQAQFHAPGPLDTDLEQVAVQGDTVAVEASLTAQTTAPLETVWHVYSRGKLVTLDTTPASPATGTGSGGIGVGTGASYSTESPVDEEAQAAEAEYGPEAGEASLAPGTPEVIGVSAQLSKPGSEYVTLFAATRSGNQVFGGRHGLRIVRPDNGLKVSGVFPATAVAGTSGTLVLTGQGFQHPLSLTASAPGITIGTLTLVSPQEVQAQVVFQAAAKPGTVDLKLTSNGREFTFVEAFTMRWPRPQIGQVGPAVLTAGTQSVLSIHGDFFHAPSFVSLGSNVQVVSVQRVSRNLLSVTVVPASGFSGPVDVIVVGANGSAAKAGAVTVVP